MNEASTTETPRLPTVYFIDDSATMREVMKIAFRRENIGVVTCQDAVTALHEIESTQPDVVITDVIMPGKNGFEVCQYIKDHPRLGKTPVVLLSGMVDRDVTEKALRVKADELIRKPFQPQDLIARVKQLIALKGPARPRTVLTVAKGDGERPKASLSEIFGSAPIPAPRRPAATAVVSHPPEPPRPTAPVPPPRPVPRPAPVDDSRLRLELLRLESLVKKLQSELAAERDYSRALEAHIKTLQDSE